MVNSTVNLLKAVFITLGCVMVATLIYTLAIDGLPFRNELLTPWMTATLVDFYINILFFAMKSFIPTYFFAESGVDCLQGIKLVFSNPLGYSSGMFRELSAQEATHDPMYHLLLRDRDKKGAVTGSSSQLITAEVIFSALGCLMLGTLLYTILTFGSPFNKELLTPWLIATLIDFYINVAVLSVWVGYKESSWFTTFIWIFLLICLGSIVTCGYVVWQLLVLSSHDPLYLVLLNKLQRAESKYETTSG